jgi:hypothetical protein
MSLDYIICVPVYKVNKRVTNSLKSLRGYNVLIIDNSGNQECKTYEQKYGFEVLYQTENTGVSRAWNLALERNKDWTFIVSSSMVFTRDFSHILQMVEEFKGLMFRTNHGWHCVGIHKDVIEKVGRFDQNFYPGYLEDSDFDYRCRLAGIPEWETNKIYAHCQIDGGATRDGVEVRILPLRKYFMSKWNGVEQNHLPLGELEGTPVVWSGHESLFVTPFGDPSKDLSFFPQKSIKQLRKEYGFDK